MTQQFSRNRTILSLTYQRFNFFNFGDLFWALVLFWKRKSTTDAPDCFYFLLEVSKMAFVTRHTILLGKFGPEQLLVRGGLDQIWKKFQNGGRRRGRLYVGQIFAKYDW